MPRVLKTYTPRRGNVGRPTAYPWDVWLDGKIRRLEHGVDFKCKPHTLVNLIRRHAEARKLLVSVFDEGDAVVIKPHP